MASTYTTFLGLEKPGTGEQSGTWGDTTNTNMDMLDQAVDGIISVTLSATGSTGSPNSLPITDGAVSNGRNKYIEFVDGGDIGGTVYVALTPNDAEKVVYFRNSLSGSRSILMFQGTYNASNDFELLAGKDYVLKFNGGGSGATVTDVNADLTVTALTATTLNATTFTASGVITGLTVEATGDTAAGDNAAIGYTSVEGLILTGQGSTNDVTIKNDADADVIEIPTGTTTVNFAGAVDVVGDLTAATFTPDGDTASGDAAAIGYTSVEGLILTGQGSTNDVTIKNDADADVIEIPTGTVNVTVAGDLVAAGTLKATGDTAAGDGAALGYTSVEGLILTGQGSTNDVTIKNDADADVLEIPTGTVNVTVAGDLVAAGTLKATGDTAAGDGAALGFTAAEGLILTGQGSTNDVTIKNDADADVIEIPTGTVNVTMAGTVTAASTLVGNAGLHVKNGATGAGFVQFFEDSDNGTNKVTLIGPASTADVTLTLPAATDTLVGKATTDTLTNKTLTTPVLTTPVANAGVQLKNGATGAGFLEFFEDSDNGTNKVTLIGPASTADITLTLPSSAGSSGQAMVTDGNGVLSFAAVGGLYNDWAIKTGAYTLVSGDQIIVNASGATTITVPASASAGDTVTIKATGGGTVTIGRNSQNINSTAADGTLTTGKSTQLVFVNSTIGFLQL